MLLGTWLLTAWSMYKGETKEELKGKRDECKRRRDARLAAARTT